MEDRTERHDAAGRKQKHVAEAGESALPCLRSAAAFPMHKRALKQNTSQPCTVPSVCPNDTAQSTCSRGRALSTAGDVA